MKKRIAFAMPWGLPMPPVHGGAVETLVQGIIDENEIQQKLEITVFTKADSEAQKLYPNYRHTKFVPVSVSKFEEKLAWFYRGVMKKAFHRAHTPGLAYLNKLCMAMRGRKFDRVIVETQGPFVPAIYKLKPGEIDLHVHNMLTLEDEMHNPRQVGRQCRIIGVSRFINGWAGESFAAPEENCRVLLNCVDVEAFASARSQRSATREKLGIKDDELMLLFTGRLCEYKGALELARAFAKADLKNAKLVFVGSRWFNDNQMDDYQKQMQKALESCADRVQFTGYVNHSDIPAYYAAADMAVLPSTCEEAGALTVLEAQATGTPVISTISGGVPENVCPEGAVLLDKSKGLEDRLEKAIVALANDPARRAEMSEKAMAWSKNRNMQSYYENFVALMEE